MYHFGVGNQWKKNPQILWNNDHVSFVFLFNVYNQFKIYRHTLFRHPNIILLNLSSGHVSSSNLIIDQQLCVRSLSLDDLTVRSTWCPGKVDWDMHAGDVGFVSRAWQPEMLAEYKMFICVYIYIEREVYCILGGSFYLVSSI